MKNCLFLCGSREQKPSVKAQGRVCFLCLYEMVQLHYMPWHALDVARVILHPGPGHTGSRGSRTKARAANLPEQPGPQCVQAWHTPCPLQGHSHSSGRPGTRRSVRDSQGLAGRAEGPVGALG